MFDDEILSRGRPRGKVHVIEHNSSLQLAKVQTYASYRTEDHATPFTHHPHTHTTNSLTVNVLEELWLVKELWYQLLLVCATFVDVGPSTGDGEELTVSKIKPARKGEGGGGGRGRRGERQRRC